MKATILAFALTLTTVIAGAYMFRTDMQCWDHGQGAAYCVLRNRWTDTLTRQFHVMGRSEFSSAMTPSWRANARAPSVPARAPSDEPLPLECVRAAGRYDEAACWDALYGDIDVEDLLPSDKASHGGSS